MADPLSLTCNIIGVLTAAGQLISIGYSYGNSVRDFPEEVKGLVDELTSLTGVLHAIKSVVDSPAGVATTKIGPTDMARAMEPSFRDCEKMLQEMTEDLVTYQKVGSRARELVKRVTWPLKENATKEWIEKIARYKSTFSLALSADEITLMRNISSDLEELNIARNIHREEKIRTSEYQNLREILDWLSPAKPELNHRAAQRLRQAGTGRWLIEGDTFRDWLGQNRSFLYLHGIPGSGKTIISSLVIDRIQSEIDRKTAQLQGSVLTYFYFDFKDPEKQKAIYLLGSIISQLIRHGAMLPKEVKELHEMAKGAPLRSYDAETLYKAIDYLASGFAKLVIVIDAIDECGDRSGVLKHLKQLEGIRNLNLLATGRPELSIRQELESLPSLMIKKTDTAYDIRLFVIEEIEKKPKLSRLNQAIKTEIVDALTKNAKGMFLWASTCLEQIGKQRNNKAIKEALNSLPPTLEDTYERILCKIPVEDRTPATRIFRWLICSYSENPLTLEELIDAIAVEIGDSSMDPETKLNDAQDIVEICGGLVVFEEESNQLGLAHLSVKEYLLSTRILQGPAAIYKIQPDFVNRELAKACLTYILFDDFRTGPSLCEDEFQSKVEQYSLLIYAARYWPKHISEYVPGTDEILEQLLSVFFHLDEDSGKALAWKQTYAAATQSLVPRPVDFVISRYNNYLDPAVKLPEQNTLFYYAAAFGCYDAVMEFLSGGKWYKAEASEYRWPLNAAISAGHDRVIRLLLESGADPNLRVAIHGNPTSQIFFGVYSGHSDCVKTLLEYGAEEVDSTGERFKHCLRPLPEIPENTIEVLLETEYFQEGIFDGSGQGHFERAFLMAVDLGFKNCVQTLLKRGTGLANQREIYLAALARTAENGDYGGFQAILKCAGKPEEPGQYTENLYVALLQGAAYFGKDKAVELLLKAIKNSRIRELGVSLHLAALNGHTKVMDLLIRAGASPDDKDEDGWTPVISALQYGQDFAFEKLLMATENPGSMNHVCISGFGPKRWEMHPKPSNWHALLQSSQESKLEVSDDGLEVRNVALDADVDGWESVKTRYPIPPLCDNFYFELKILTPLNPSGPSKKIKAGFADGYRKYILEGCTIYTSEAGESKGTWAYSNLGAFTDGVYWWSNEPSPKYGPGDTIGFYFQRIRRTVTFSCNGLTSGTMITNIQGKIFPFITLGAGMGVRANFGDEPFTYGKPQI